MNKKENEENNEKMKFTIIFSLSRLPNGFVLLCAVARQLFTTYKIYIYIYIQSESREPRARARKVHNCTYIFVIFPTSISMIHVGCQSLRKSEKTNMNNSNV